MGDLALRKNESIAAYYQCYEDLLVDQQVCGKKSRQPYKVIHCLAAILEQMHYFGMSGIT